MVGRPCPAPGRQWGPDLYLERHPNLIPSGCSATELDPFGVLGECGRGMSATGVPSPPRYQPRPAGIGLERGPVGCSEVCLRYRYTPYPSQPLHLARRPIVPGCPSADTMRYAASGKVIPHQRGRMADLPVDPSMFSNVTSNITALDISAVSGHATRERGVLVCKCYAGRCLRNSRFSSVWRAPSLLSRLVSPSRLGR